MRHRRVSKLVFPAMLLCAAALLAQEPRGEWKSGIEFARIGDVGLTLDAWVPEGKGPFPTVIVVHGGGWEKRR